MTLICCGKDMPETIDDLLDDKTEIHTTFRQFAKHRAAGGEIEFLLDVARHRNIKAIYDTYIAREDLGGAACGGFDFGFDPDLDEEAFYQAYPQLRPKKPMATKPKPKARFTLVNRVFSKTKKAKKKAAIPTPPAPIAPAAPPAVKKTLNGQAFGRNGEVDEMLDLGRANNFSETDWRPLLDDASTKVKLFLDRDMLTGGNGFFASEQFGKALGAVVERLIRFNASAIVKQLGISSSNGAPSSDDFILIAALVETKLGLLFESYNSYRLKERSMRSGEKYFNSLKSTWGFEMEFWTFRNYLNRF
ncbi:hypothetical protein [uncultured Tateyamaria sp.]|uniref:hypothetical protein n=1 Tax=Tateyamaria sp. 1078 TaxID=3417464 RepID=UPI0026356455|nr:hypothetical protein [uncultured Tateyamaria sp.]